jgi:hypothetical protein
MNSFLLKLYYLNLYLLYNNKMTEIYSQIPPFESEDLFDAVITWRDDKIQDLSYCLVIFFNYLTVERPGFIKVENSPYQVSVKPVITRSMADYLISEIFPCGIMGHANLIISPTPHIIESRMRTIIEDYIDNKSYLIAASEVKNTRKFQTGNGLEIQQDAFQILWNYISNGIYDLYIYSNIKNSPNGSTNDDIIKEITKNKNLAIDRRNTSTNYGFVDDLENSAFQALLYIMISLVDWLEIDEIGEIEVITTYKLIYPRDIQKKITPKKDSTSSAIISSAIISKDLIVTDDAIDLISAIMFDIGERKKNLRGDRGSTNRRIINRLMVFCNPI